MKSSQWVEHWPALGYFDHNLRTDRSALYALPELSGHLNICLYTHLKVLSRSIAKIIFSNEVEQPLWFSLVRQWVKHWIADQVVQSLIPRNRIFFSIVIEV